MWTEVGSQAGVPTGLHKKFPRESQEQEEEQEQMRGNRNPCSCTTPIPVQNSKEFKNFAFEIVLSRSLWRFFIKVRE